MPAPCSRRPQARLGFAIALSFFFAASYVHQPPSRCPTAISRLDLLHAVARGSVCIDAYHTNTSDKSEFRGHFYSDKAPGTVAVTLTPFAVGALAMKAAGDTMESERGWLVTSWIACSGSIALVASVGAWAIFAWLCNYVETRYALVTSLALFLGAAPLPYATMMFSHSLVVGLLSIAVWAIDKPSPSSNGSWVSDNKWKLLAGFCCGLSLASEYTSGLVVAGLCLWLLLRSAAVAGGHDAARIPSPATQKPKLLYRPPEAESAPDRLAAQSDVDAEGPSQSSSGELRDALFRVMRARSFQFFIAAAPPLFLIPLYSWLCFRNPFILPYSLNCSFPEMKKGVYAIEWPDPWTAFHLLFSPTRGLFFWTPFLLLALAGYSILIRTHRRKFLLMYGLPALQIVVISGRVWDWQAGPTLGPRYLAPILPLMALPCALGLRRFPRTGSMLALYSILITTVATLTNASPIAQYFNPLVELHLWLLLRGDLVPNIGSLLGLHAAFSVLAFYALISIPICIGIYIYTGGHRPESRPLRLPNRTWLA